VPSNRARDGKFRRLEVKITDDKGMKIRHKQGYYAPLAQASDKEQAKK
jgi:hypothetical protein